MTSSFEILQNSFKERTAEARGIIALRRSSGSAEELARLAESTDQLEKTIQKFHEQLTAEHRILSEQGALIRTRVIEQAEDIRALNDALPPHMKPSQPKEQPKEQTTTTTKVTAKKETEEKQETGTKKRKAKSLQESSNGEITEEELQSVPSYMRGRLTVEKCNEALKEAKKLIQQRYKLISSRSNNSGLTEDAANKRDKARELEELAKQAGISERFFTDVEITGSNVLHLDIAGRMLISTLRHLKRFHEFTLPKGHKCWSLL